MKRESPSFFELRQLKCIADIQFGIGSGNVLFPNNVLVERSKSTKRIRYVYLDEHRICSYRVTDGFLVLSLFGGELLHNANCGNKVICHPDAEPFIRKSKSLFSQHVIDSDEYILVKDEVIITNKTNEFLGVGTAKLSSFYMQHLKRGVAVNTRKGKKN